MGSEPRHENNASIHPSTDPLDARTFSLCPSSTMSQGSAKGATGEDTPVGLSDAALVARPGPVDNHRRVRLRTSTQGADTSCGGVGVRQSCWDDGGNNSEDDCTGKRLITGSSAVRRSNMFAEDDSYRCCTQHFVTVYAQQDDVLCVTVEDECCQV